MERRKSVHMHRSRSGGVHRITSSSRADTLFRSYRPELAAGVLVKDCEPKFIRVNGAAERAQDLIGEISFQSGGPSGSYTELCAIAANDVTIRGIERSHGVLVLGKVRCRVGRRVRLTAAIERLSKRHP